MRSAWNRAGSAYGRETIWTFDNRAEETSIEEDDSNLHLWLVDLKTQRS